ncbi:MAG: DNA topoisomerase I [Aigarchaeota archaeon]|nr:DNA topoisomerase I [Aigarchaeota archaeon]
MEVLEATPMKIMVVSEKPDACMRIAAALDPGAVSKSVQGMPFWIGKIDGNTVIFASSIGHLYALSTKQPGYPVWTYSWRPRAEVERTPRRFRESMNIFMRGLAALDSEIDLYVNACDYDLEGSLIGYMVLHRLLRGKDQKAKRMFFSTLVPEELRQAFRRLQPMDAANVEAALARHETDFLYGVNVSRALTSALTSVGEEFRVLSAGRVQSVVLNWVVEREREIRSHTPLPSWILGAKVKADGASFKANYAAGAVLELAAAEKVQAESTGKWAEVVRAERSLESVAPPPPFRLGTLQADAYRYFGFSPDRVLEVAEKLYLDALISYPRTSSEKFPRADVRGILEGLSRIPPFKTLAEDLLRKPDLRPIEGRGVDRAHPSIYATGTAPKGRMTGDDWRIYEMVCRRTMSCFADPAILQRTTIVLRCADHLWEAEGISIVSQGFYRYYEYGLPKEKPVPTLERGSQVFLSQVEVTEEMTKPPPSFTPPSLLSRMERCKIGTPATRASIIKTLKQRGYVRGPGYKATDLGLTVADTLLAFCAELTNEEMTRLLEEKLEAIVNGETSRSIVVKEVRQRLAPLVLEMNRNQRRIGMALAGEASIPCRLCGRQATSTCLCRDHLRSEGRLKEAVEEWTRRYGGRISRREMEKCLAEIPETGAWIKELLLEKSEGMS